MGTKLKIFLKIYGTRMYYQNFSAPTFKSQVGPPQEGRVAGKKMTRERFSIVWIERVCVKMKEKKILITKLLICILYSKFNIWLLQ